MTLANKISGTLCAAATATSEGKNAHTFQQKKTDFTDIVHTMNNKKMEISADYSRSGKIYFRTKYLHFTRVKNNKLKKVFKKCQTDPKRMIPLRKRM